MLLITLTNLARLIQVSKIKKFNRSNRKKIKLVTSFYPLNPQADSIWTLISLINTNFISLK